ncbi:MAG: aa3-type cytochrome c oxidase subunit IV [Alphaproteobacteria bacterium]
MSVNNELQRHQQDWNEFVRFTTYAGAGIIVLLILMAVFLFPR